MNIENLTGIGAMVFGILGSYGICRQTWLIWSSKSAESVSGMWTIVSHAMFVSFLIYGLQKDSFPMEFQGWLRVIFLIPVTVGFWMYGQHSWKHVVLAVVSVMLIVLMYEKSLAWIIFTGFSFAGVGSSFVQAYTIHKNRSRGKVSIELQTIYFFSIVFWFVYAFVRKDIPFILVSIGFIFSYGSTIIAWLKYPGKTVSERTS